MIKRFLLLILVSSLLFVGCAPFIGVSGSGSFSVVLPSSASSSRQVSAAAPSGACQFIITVKDADGTLYTKSGMTGETLSFTVRLGEASVSAVAVELPENAADRQALITEVAEKGDAASVAGYLADSFMDNYVASAT